MEDSGFLLVIPCVVLLTYMVVLIRCSILNKSEKARQQNWGFSGSLPNVSLLIAFRNENLRIQPLLDSLAALSFPREKLEIIMVDDHSSDATHEKIKFAAQANNLNIRILFLPEGKYGKKAAMALAREKATSEFLFFTDADVILPKEWLIQMLYCQQNTAAAMVCSEVEVANKNSILHIFESLEQAALVAFSAASVASGKVFLCNGAGYLVLKSSLEKIELPVYWDRSPGGDDIMLLHAMHKAGEKIAYCRTDGARVQLAATETREFLQQRIRWGSKVFLGNSSGNLLPAMLVWLFHFINLWLFGSLFIATGFYAILICFLAGIFLRGIWEAGLVRDFLTPGIDLMSFQKAENAENKNKPGKPGIISIVVLISILAPFYSLYVALAGPLLLLYRNFQWKGRNYSS